MTFLARFAENLNARWKWLLSFRKTSWDLHDYPIRVRKLKPDPESAFQPPRFQPAQWHARVVNWFVDGTGNTRAEALADLRSTFEVRKAKFIAEGKPLPRPGTNVPIEFASQQNIDRHAELSEDFIQRVLGLPWAWISDESTLWDFHTESNNDAYIAKIREIYGVDISDIESARLYEIFDRIAQSAPRN